MLTNARQSTAAGESRPEGHMTKPVCKFIFLQPVKVWGSYSREWFEEGIWLFKKIVSVFQRHYHRYLYVFYLSIAQCPSSIGILVISLWLSYLHMVLVCLSRTGLSMEVYCIFMACIFSITLRFVILYSTLDFITILTYQCILFLSYDGMINHFFLNLRMS